MAGSGWGGCSERKITRQQREKASGAAGCKMHIGVRRQAGVAGVAGVHLVYISGRHTPKQGPLKPGRRANATEATEPSS